MRAVFGVIVFILMALPLAWFYVAMYWGYSITKDIAAIERGVDVAMPIFPPMKWMDDRKMVQAAFSPDSFTSGRNVSFTLVVPFADMLGPDEEMPADALKELYATLRAPGYLIGYCDEILSALGSACTVSGFDADVRHEPRLGDRMSGDVFPEAGLATLTGTLSYIPAYDMGNPALVQNGQVVGVKTRLNDGQAVEDTSTARAQLFVEARELCDRLKAEFGTCVIRSITLEPVRHLRGAADTLTAQIRGTASFSLMADETKHRRKGVQEALDTIVADRLAALDTPAPAQP